MDTEENKNGYLVIQIGNTGANWGSISGNVECWMDLRNKKQSGQELLAK